MPHYAFRCPQCDTEFEVSRPMKEATHPALCPADGATGARVFTATVTLGGRGSGAEQPPATNTAPSAPAGGHGHGHSHGPGGHSH